MKKFNFDKKIIFTLIIAIIVTTLITVSVKFRHNGERSNPIISALNDSISFIDRIIAVPAKFLHNGVELLDDLVNTYEENQQLKAKLDNYDEAILTERNQKEELKKLKDELNLNNMLTSYKKISANVISRSPDAWQNIVIVDRGSSEGIEKNMAVMSQKGLIGRVMQVNAHTSKVELLTTSNKATNHFPVRISGSGGDRFGLLDHFDEATQTLVVLQVKDGNELKKGDIVQTSGLGGNSPKNLIVGTVVELKTGSDGFSKEIYVKPYAEMYDISVVTIIKRMIENGEGNKP
ncbi:MAG: rod shape-determining protein MreC [Lactobacillales bacterium]|nr:rod shape-determining protein MreC [Lactobacillales bacterium]